MPSATLAYIELQNSNNSLRKKFRVLLEGYQPVEVSQKTIRRTVTGVADVQEGPRWKTWQLTLKVRETETETNFGSIADLITFFSYNNPQGTPTNKLQFFDALDTNGDGTGDQYTVVIVGDMPRRNIMFKLSGSDSYHAIRLNLEQV